MITPLIRGMSLLQIQTFIKPVTMESIKKERYLQKAVVAWLTADENLSAATILRCLKVSLHLGM